LLKSVFNMFVYGAIAVLLIMQSNEKSTPLFVLFHGLNYAIIACIIMTIVNAYFIVHDILYENTEYYNEDNSVYEEHY
jgi:hypothetical protein